jgi:membrane-bound serine protease (ClpP class)
MVQASSIDRSIDKAEIVEYRPGVQIGFLQVMTNPLVASLTLILGFLLLLVGLHAPGFGSEVAGVILLMLSLLSFQVIGIELTTVLFVALGFILMLAEIKTQIGVLGLAGATCIVIGSFLLFPSPQWLLAPEVSIQIRNTLVAVSSVLSLLFGVIVYKVAQAKRMKAKTGAEIIEGSRGVAATRLAPYGDVRVGGEFWRAYAEEGFIDKDAEIMVVGRKGLLLIVRAKTDSTSPESSSEKEVS